MYLHPNDVEDLAESIASVINLSVKVLQSTIFVTLPDGAMEITITPPRATRYAVIHTRGTQCRTMRFSDEKQLVKYIRKYAR
jgi:hypothetical protein